MDKLEERCAKYLSIDFYEKENGKWLWKIEVLPGKYLFKSISFETDTLDIAKIMKEFAITLNNQSAIDNGIDAEFRVGVWIELGKLLQRLWSGKMDKGKR